MSGTVYIVEDETGIQGLYEDAFSEFELSYKIFSKSQDCLEAIASGEWPVALICDYILPDKNGIQCIKEAREMELDCPAIIITGARTKEMALECINLNIQAIIDKPCNIDEVIHHLTKLISQYESFGLSTKLLSEIVYLGECAENLAKSYKEQIEILQTIINIKSPPLKLMILEREAAKWEKELSKTKKNTNDLQGEYNRLKRMKS